MMDFIEIKQFYPQIIFCIFFVNIWYLIFNIEFMYVVLKNTKRITFEKSFNNTISVESKTRVLFEIN